MIGISLLTLVPGVVGGSETYARELVRGLSRVGRFEYCIFVPAIAQDAANGLPGSVVASYRARQSTVGRLRAMAAASAFPGKIRRTYRKPVAGRAGKRRVIAIRHNLFRKHAPRGFSKRNGFRPHRHAHFA